MKIIPLAGFLRVAWRFAVYGSLGTVLTMIVVFVIYLDGRPDLNAWHTVDLDEEFTRHSDLPDFAAYLELEDRLFRQLDREIVAKSGQPDSHSINRFRRDSLADPERWSPNWNRSFLLEATDPRAMVLLLHGLSDSPYSLRQLGKKLHENGATVLGLRIPGHGTAPSGLTTVRWQDMAAAVRLAVKHLADSGDGRPLHIVGYSNGAALAIQYVLSAIDDPDLPGIERVVLLSPAIGVTPAAAFAVWQARLGTLLGLDKLAWNSILPEYEPFKYGSFAINAGDLSHRLSREIQRQLDELYETGRLEAIPPTLSFSSVIDATVDVTALVGSLLNRLEQGEHELVLFDLNQTVNIDDVLLWKPDAVIAALRSAQRANYLLRVVTNHSPESPQVVEQLWRADAKEPLVHSLDMHWPADLHSLSHVSLPFPPDDPLYGGIPGEESPGIQLGNLAFRGERGALAIADSAQLRLRWNPFYDYLEDLTIDFLELESGGAAGR